MLLANIDGAQHTARIVLTGRGGGVWNQPLQLGAEAGEPSVTIVADALEFCRLAAQRIEPADLDCRGRRPDGPGHHGPARRLSLRGLSICSLQLGWGRGVADEVQHLHGAGHRHVEQPCAEC